MCLFRIASDKISVLIYARSQLASSVDFMRQTSKLEMRTWAQVNFSYVSNKILLAKVNGATLNQTEPVRGVLRRHASGGHSKGPTELDPWQNKDLFVNS